MQQNDMENLVSRTERLIGALTGAIMSTTEAAAERVELAAQVAMVQARMTAFGAVLDTISVKKEALLERQKSARGSMKVLLGKQLELLTIEETALLERAGLSAEAARTAVESADTAPKLYARNGKKFQALGEAGATTG